MSAVRTLSDLDVRGKRVFVRCDFNVPVENGRITSDARIARTAPTIKLLLKQGASCVLASHFGRPKKGPDTANSLKPVAERLSSLLGQPVALAPDCVGKGAEEAVSRMKPGEVVLLENLRFHAGEEGNDAAFARQLAALAQAYVNDAFGASHRAHASIVGVPKLLPSAAGLLLAAEVEHLGGLLERPERPFAAILGGAKVSDKIEILESLASRVDCVLIGGAMAYTFLSAKGVAVGASRVEKEMIETSKRILADAEARKVEVLLPVDHVVAERFEASAPSWLAEGEIPAGRMGLDIGPKTVALFRERLNRSRTVLWNGPMGVFEMDRFANGTRELMRILAGMRHRAKVVVGGGDSAAAAEQQGLTESFAHVSTGGGASLEYLAQGTLPGIEALKR